MPAVVMLARSRIAGESRLLSDATLSYAATFRNVPQRLHRAVADQRSVGGVAANYRTPAHFGHSVTRAAATLGWFMSWIQSLYESLIVNDTLSHRGMFLASWLVHAEPKAKDLSVVGAIDCG